ncbi:MAG TPA: prepilin-type N-terminal cleavage/methylation domain-containing protein [Steroidobacteraceae bacterium]|nr:prepilin-type N-terminal cleavage/methylation domain-containing protein [Steroidobacteraceae bacterium]
MRRRAQARGFTLVEVVVAMVVGAIVMIFAAMFLVAPIDAYEAHGLRSEMVANTSTAWPRMEDDIRQALPNSVRARPNGNYVALELLQTCGYARYTTPPSASFDVVGTASGVFGANCVNFTNIWLSVNNAGDEAYTQATSMTPRIPDLNPLMIPQATPGEAKLSLLMPINTNSPRNRIYLVERPVTYLCDQAQGTITRYAGYPIAALQVSRDTPAELAGSPSVEVVARGLTSCLFDVQRLGNLPEQVRVHLTSARGAEVVHLQYGASVENLP